MATPPAPGVNPSGRSLIQAAEADIEESVQHDFSTSETGIVPLNRRRPLWHFAGLWLTFQSGFSFLFVGFTLHNAGYGLLATSGSSFLPPPSIRSTARSRPISVPARARLTHCSRAHIRAQRIRPGLHLPDCWPDRLGGLPGEPPGPDLERPLRLEGRHGHRDPPGRAHDLQINPSGSPAFPRSPGT